MENVQKIYNLELDSEKLEFQSFIFKKVKDYDNRIRKLYMLRRTTTDHISSNPTETFLGRKRTQRKRIGEHIHTFNAMLKPEVSAQKDSVFVKNGKEIHDIVILFSLMTGRTVCLNEQRAYSDHKVYDKILDKSEYSPFLVNYSKGKFTEDKLLRTGLIPCVFYYLTSRHQYSINVKFILSWLSLESMATAYSKEKNQQKIIPESNFRKLRRKIEKEINNLDHREISKSQIEMVKRNIEKLNSYTTSANVLFLLRSFGLISGVKNGLEKKRIREWTDLRNTLVHRGLVRDEKILSEVIDLNFLLHDILTVIIFSLLRMESFRSKFRLLSNIKQHYQRGGYWPSWYAENPPRIDFIKLEKT